MRRKLGLAIVAVTITVVAPLEGQWRPVAFHSVSSPIEVPQDPPRQPAMSIATTTVIGGLFGAALAGGVWAISCTDSATEACEWKWGRVTIGAGAVFGALVGWVVGEFQHRPRYDFAQRVSMETAGPPGN